LKLLMELCKEDKWSYAIEEKRSAKEWVKQQSKKQSDELIFLNSCVWGQIRE
jgi:hypothetical protein